MKTDIIKNPDFINFIENIDPAIFVKLHQETFKDHYIQHDEEYDEFNEEDIENIWDLFYDYINDKYHKFFINKGLDGTYEWLNCVEYQKNYSEDMKRYPFTMNMIKAELDNSSDDDGRELFDELYNGCASGFSDKEFFLDLVWHYENELDGPKKHRRLQAVRELTLNNLLK